jgi:Domain of unknown function (DUF4365)
MRRTKSQSIGATGERMLALWLEETGLWIARKLEEDFGVDLEAELVEPEVQGQILKIQVKSGTRVKLKNGFVSCRLEKRYLQYALSCRVPVILVLIDVVRRTGWYVWLQGWALDHYHNRIADLPRTVLIPIPVENTLKGGLNGRLKEIAAWRTDEQLVIGLIDCIRSAFAIQKDSVIEPLSRILADLGRPTPLFPIAALVDEVIAIGHRIWATKEGNKLSRILFTVCEKYGDLITREQVFPLVTRSIGSEETYSRTGINAIGLLYERFPEHTRCLKLPDLFGNYAGGLPRYFCELFEKFSKAGKGLFYFCSKDLDLRIGDWDIISEDRDRLFDKIANRGYSAILDFAYRVP